MPLQLRSFDADYVQVEPLLRKALSKERKQNDPAAEVFGVAAEGVTRAARLLTSTYTLVVTNVPYLLRRKQNDVLQEFCSAHYPNAKNDLATVFVKRCQSLCTSGGASALVTPQNWLFLGSYKNMRQNLLRSTEWDLIARLGSGAFTTIGGEVVNVVLLVLAHSHPETTHRISGLDVSLAEPTHQKDALLRSAAIQSTDQLGQLRNPDARIVLSETDEMTLLSHYADALQGTVTGDFPSYGRCFWELPQINVPWRKMQSTTETSIYYGGREHILLWERESQALANNPQARVQGRAGWQKLGVAVRQIGHLPATLYCGDVFNINVPAIIPKDRDHRPAIWAFCSSPEFNKAVRQVDQALKVTNATLVKVPFDLDRWQAVADATGPLPTPHSDDPTQWLFGGHPVSSTEPLQVAAARMLNYHWPEQKSDSLDTLTAGDGIVCLPAVAGEAPAAEQLRALLAAAYGDEWSPTQAERLLTTVGFAGKGLDQWLRDGFFEQHCRIFHNRPFIWHVWDGRKDGFSALVNYHRLDGALLNKLIYTYLGAWIAVQQAERNAEVAGADGRLVAALNLQKKLEAIRDGEPPYDIYVRWKPLHQQPLGWEPDLNDGVRLNIRPFVTAGVLRGKFTIHWKKDRGTNPNGSERLNDLHYTLAEKRAARMEAGQ